MALPPANSFGPRDLADVAAMLAALPAGAVIKVGTKTMTLGAAGQVTLTGPLLRATAVGLTAAGTTQATALALTSDINVITTAAAGSGFVLPNFGVGSEVLVVNRGANAANGYPFVGGGIDALGTNIALALAAASFR